MYQMSKSAEMKKSVKGQESGWDISGQGKLFFFNMGVILGKASLRR